jgi:transposase-like protein
MNPHDDPAVVRPERKVPINYSAAQRAAHLADWQRSGLNGPAYARSHGIHKRNLYRWRSKARQHSRESSGGESSPFVRVVVSRAVAGVAGAKAATPAPGLSPALPEVRMRCDRLEFVVGAAVSIPQLTAVLVAIRREVLDV